MGIFKGNQLIRNGGVLAVIQENILNNLIELNIGDIGSLRQIDRHYFYEPKDYVDLSEESKIILNTPNAGGSSTRSEAYTMHFLVKNFGARDIKDEMNIKYFHEWWKKCDFITRIYNIATGVSVTRAIFTDRYNPDDLDLKISKLLWKKLSGCL